MRKINLQTYYKKLAKSKPIFSQIGADNGIGLRPYVNPTFNRSIPHPIRNDTKEFYGKNDGTPLDLDYSYRNSLFAKINPKLLENEIKIRRVKDQSKFMRISTENVNLWKDYTNEISKTLPEDRKIDELTLIKLKDLFSRTKNRNKSTISSESIVNFLSEFSKNHLFDVPLHDKNMAMIVHPHWGYFCKQKREFSFEEIIQFFEKEIIASYVRDEGYSLISNRITAFNYWSIHDPNLKGYLTFAKFIKALDSIAVDTSSIKDVNDLKKEFEFIVNDIKWDFKYDTPLYRFRFFEHIFLQRSALY